MFLSRWVKAYQNMDLRRRGKWLLTASMLLGCLTGWAVLEQINSSRRALGTWESVLVASRELQPNTVIQKELLDARPMPLRYVLPGMMLKAELEQLDGTVVLVTIPAGSPITRAMVRQSSTGNPDRRTYTLSASRQVVFAGLKQGDLVDVLAIYERDKQGLSQLIARQVEVVAAWESGRVQHVTLSVTPDDAMLLAYYENYGRQLRLLPQG